MATHCTLGVMDILPKTDFPDIRKNCIVESNQGNVMLLPRERKLTRFYVQISNEYAKQGQMSAEQIDLKEIMEQGHFIALHARIELLWLVVVLQDWATISREIFYSKSDISRRRCCSNVVPFCSLLLSILSKYWYVLDTHSPKVGMNMSMQDGEPFWLTN